MIKPLCIDLFCGLGGWTGGFLAEGWDCIGFDIERHDYGSGGYPGQLVLQDVLTLHGSQFRNADCIVASPPCQNYSYMAMPWSRAKAMRDRWLKDGPNNRLFDACFRIQREACQAAGRYIPMVVENVRGAQPWVGRAAWSYGSFYLWGDVPALMPSAKALKWGGCNGVRFDERPPSDFHRRRLKRSAFAVCDVGNGARFTSRDCGVEKGFAKEWRDSPNGMPMMSSKSSARKAASSQIAKIPFALSRWIAQTYYPSSSRITLCSAAR